MDEAVELGELALARMTSRRFASWLLRVVEGLTSNDVSPLRSRRSIGKERTFSSDQSDHEHVLDLLEQLTQSVLKKLELKELRSPCRSQIRYTASKHIRMGVQYLLPWMIRMCFSDKSADCSQRTCTKMKKFDLSVFDWVNLKNWIPVKLRWTLSMNQSNLCIRVRVSLNPARLSGITMPSISAFSDKPFSFFVFHTSLLNDSMSEVLEFNPHRLMVDWGRNQHQQRSFRRASSKCDGKEGTNWAECSEEIT